MHLQDKEKTADTEVAENAKDIATEKEQNPPQLEVVEEVPTENGDETLNESKISEAPIVENGDSNKKPKKEKVKKKWSFRSISFSKKDKQKPAKKDEATNGECEKVPEEVSLLFILF